jgi:hypothetical protein
MAPRAALTLFSALVDRGDDRPSGARATGFMADWDDDQEWEREHSRRPSAGA